MCWQTTRDLNKFLMAADGYLRSQGAEGILLLTAARGCRGEQPLFGWWAVAQAPDDVRGAFVHDPPSPLVIVGRVPEIAAGIAAVLYRGRAISGVDASMEAADAFAAAWGHRTGLAARLHRHTKVYRMGPSLPDPEGPTGGTRVATIADRALLVDWVRAFGTETGDFSPAPEKLADDLISYGGAIFWEADGVAVALATLTRPVENAVRISMVYTPHSVRHQGYSGAVTVAASRAALANPAVREVLLISDRTSPVRRASDLGYELAGERVLLTFGAPTGPMPRLTGPLVRLGSRVGHG